MKFKLDRYFVAGVLAGFLILIFAFKLKSDEPEWIARLESLGMVTRTGDGSRVLVIRSYSCPSCRELDLVIGPILQEMAANDTISLITIDAPEQDTISETVLAIKWWLTELEPTALIPLHHALTTDFADLKTETDLKNLLAQIGFEDLPFESLQIDKARNVIHETRSILNEIGVSRLPVWVVEGKVISGETPDDYLAALTIALGN